jgi:hypothetical protein
MKVSCRLSYVWLAIWMLVSCLPFGAEARSGSGHFSPMSRSSKDVSEMHAQAAPGAPSTPQSGRSSSATLGSSGATQGSGGPSRAAGPTPSVGPSSTLPNPMPPIPSVAPLSPQLPTTQSTAGGTARQDTSGSSSGAGGTSSEATPSVPGGGGKTLADCMSFWEPATHMTKAEWRRACQRTLNRLHGS